MSDFECPRDTSLKRAIRDAEEDVLMFGRAFIVVDADGVHRMPAPHVVDMMSCWSCGFRRPLSNHDCKQCGTSQSLEAREVWLRSRLRPVPRGDQGDGAA